MSLLVATLMLLVGPVAEPVCRSEHDEVFVYRSEDDKRWIPSAEDVDRVVALIDGNPAAEITLRAKDSYNIGLVEVEAALGQRTDRPLGTVFLTNSRRPQYMPGEEPQTAVDVWLDCP